VSVVELGAAALVVVAIVVCVLAVVFAAADAGRVVAQRLLERAESRTAHDSPPVAGDRSRDPHDRGIRERPLRRRG